MEHLRTPLARFLALSLVVHGLILFLWPAARIGQKPQEPITVSFLPLSEEATVVRSPEREATGRAKAPGAGARKSSFDEKSLRQPTVHKEQPRQDKPSQTSAAPPPVSRSGFPSPQEKPLAPVEKMVHKETEQKEPPPPRRETTKEPTIIAERSIPTVKELLPPATWSSRERGGGGQDAPLRLDTRDPQYVTYFGSIKREIELVWEYPEQALRYGLQGKLLLEFSILSNGELENAKVVRSSGSHLLDQEALRAVKAAAPFRPIPPWIDKSRIDIVASFEYLDNRLNYRFGP